jgi:hypothetical protein
MLEQPVDLGAGGDVGGQDHFSPTVLDFRSILDCRSARTPASISAAGLPMTIPGELA